jgi:hypothetical protein
MSLNVVSDGMGSWSYGFMEPFLRRTFPKTGITFDNAKSADLVIRSHFTPRERAVPYTCPYIVWSGESSPVFLLKDREPLFELNTFHSDRPNSVYFPHLIAECKETRRPSTQCPKRYCCSYAFSNPVSDRELLFRRMRSLEPSCYAFGRCSFTKDNPFIAPANIRGQNHIAFREFAFNVAMENAIVPGYMTEKIGFAFCSGSVPIYWGDTDTVSDFFNPPSFFNVRDYKTPIAAAETAVQIWRDPQKLQKFLDVPITLNNRLTDYEAIYTEYRPWQKPMVDQLRDAFPDLS